MILLKEFIEKMERYAPPDLARFEYVGLMQGDLVRQVRKVGLTLDYCLRAIEAAIQHKCDLLITHHGPTSIRYPLIGNNLQKIVQANRANLAVYREHLTLDFCEGGIIDTLCTLLDIPAQKTHLDYEGHHIYGGVNLVNDYPLTLAELDVRIRKAGIKTYRTAGKLKKSFRKIAVTSGAGFFGEFMDQLRPEVYIAGELEQEATKYAEDLGIMLIELGHHASEVLALKAIAPQLAQKLKVPVQFIEIPDTINIIETKEVV